MKARAAQDVYPRHIVEEIKEVFGEESVEYGMALCGAQQLREHLSYYWENFTAESLLTVKNGGEGADYIVETAEWVVKVSDLRTRIEETKMNSKPPSWFEVKPT